MNTQRMTQLTVAALVVIIAGVIIWSRMGSAAPASLDLTDQPTYGNGPVQVALFEDFLCPHCATFTETVLPQLKRDFGDTGLATLNFVNFQVMPGSEAAASVMECVYQQDNDLFWELKNVFMRSQAQIGTRTAAQQLAVEYGAGLDGDQLQACMDDGSGLERVRADSAMAQSAGATGTPSVYVDGKPVQLSYQAIANAINAAAN